MEEDTDLIEIIELELMKENNPDGIMEVIEALILTDGAEVKKKTLEKYGIEMDSEFIEEVEAMEGFEKYNNMIHEERGFKKGIAEGLAEGEAKGKTEGLAVSVKGLMKSLNKTKEEAIELLSLTEEEKESVRKLL